MKTTIAIAAALAAGASTQMFAANPVSYAKEGTITFALTAHGQSSVSTSATVQDAGNWSQGPKFYKTVDTKVTQATILQCIGETLYGSPTFFSSKAKLVLVQGELSGFFNISPDLAAAFPNSPTNTPPDWDGTWTVTDPNASTVIANGPNSTYVRLATGRHFEPVPTNYATAGEFPPGHFEPWGQIFVKDVGNTHGVGAVDVTYFFKLSVHECYDCFYLNSFVSDASFAFKSSTTGGKVGPAPCCSTPTDTTSSLTGNGTDSYYLSLSFDDSQQNPYLNPNDENLYLGTPGIIADFGGGIDGTTPDDLPYVDSIISNLGQPAPYLARFTLNGICTYKWTLKKLNASDDYPDFIGTANYTANGYGFIALVCQLMTGTATIAEANVANGLSDVLWYDDWYGYDEGLDYPNTSPTPYNVPASLTHHDYTGANGW